MARERAISFSLRSASSSLSLPAAPGIIFITEESGPIFFNSSIWSSRSLKSISLRRSLSTIFMAFCSSMPLDAFSMRERISPMPKIREAIRSG